jgi:hypothetical protein
MTDDLAALRRAKSKWRSRPSELLPTVGRRTDGQPLFYRGKTHSVVGETEAGKDWLAQVVARDEMIAGNDVLYLDFEDEEDTAISRLLTLGLDPAVGEALFDHKRLKEPIGDALITTDDARWEAMVIDGPLRSSLPGDHVTDTTLIVVAGVTQAMELEGLNPISNVDIATYHRMVLEPLCELHESDYGGRPAVVALDHVTKDPSSRGRYALGGGHKLNIVTGASYILENREPFGIGLTGRSVLKIAKDRPGLLRQHGVKAGDLYRFGNLVLASHGKSSADAMIEPPSSLDQGGELDSIKTEIAELVRREGPIAGRRIEPKVSGNSAKIRKALRELVADNYLSKSPHTLLNPFDQEAL